VQSALFLESWRRTNTLAAVRPVLAFSLLVALIGCGETERERPRPPVRIEILAPSDLTEVDDDTVEVRGSVVPPSARVLVAGQTADVDNGEFTATVSLDAGANVIDVQAAAPERPAAMTALRVVRIVPVEVPALDGLSPEEAADTLKGLGLVPDVRDTGDVLDDLFFGDPGVCGTEPEAGTLVKPGSTVTVVVQGACGG
jgi:hypothetical protein